MTGTVLTEHCRSTAAAVALDAGATSAAAGDAGASAVMDTAAMMRLLNHIQEEMADEELAAEPLSDELAADPDAESAYGAYNRVATDDPYS